MDEHRITFTSYGFGNSSVLEDLADELLSILEAEHGRLGPVICVGPDRLDVVVAIDAADAAAAIEATAPAVRAALERAGVRSRFSRVATELVDAPAAARA